MASNKFVKNKDCNACANTGILHATFVREAGAHRIAVVVCGAHSSSNSSISDLAEKNLETLHKSSGLPIEILRVEKPILM